MYHADWMPLTEDIGTRLAKCFQIVFPDLPGSEVASMSQAGYAAWDSVAAITLANVIEEEFEIEMDLDALADLDSFPKILTYVEGKLNGA
jgi:acyl carrier protein